MGNPPFKRNETWKQLSDSSNHCSEPVHPKGIGRWNKGDLDDSVSAAAREGVTQRSIQKSLSGVCTQSRDGRYAHHDDQGEHDRVLDCGWTILVMEESRNWV
jgi:hypothetical protein